MVNYTYNCGIEDEEVTISRNGGDEAVNISFQRTIRVPDGKKPNQLPPGLGKFPLFKVKNYQKTLPESMGSKGRLFMPMYGK